MASDLAQLRADVADDLSRDDISPRINRAIASAVRHYEGERFWFNEFWRYTATLSSGATSIPFSQLGIVPVQIDRVSVVLTGTTYGDVLPAIPGEIGWLRDGPVTSRPCRYALTADAIIFDVTAGSDYAVILDGIKKVASASASESGGTTAAWYSDARDLIRARAAWDINLNYLKDDEEAARAFAAEQQALDMLQRKTFGRRATGTLRSYD